MASPRGFEPLSPP